MSLVHKTLQKLKEQSGTSSVPPGMINLAPKRRSKTPNKWLLAALGITVIGFVFTLFLDGGGKYASSPSADNQQRPAVVTQGNNKTSAPMQKSSPAQAAPAVSTPSEAEIQKRIDDAVAKALQDADIALLDGMDSTIEATENRAKIVTSLPAQAQAKIVDELGGIIVDEVEASADDSKTVMPEESANIVNADSPEFSEEDPQSVMSQLKSRNGSAASDSGDRSPAGFSSGSAVSAVKPILTKEQRSEFDKKIKYNTLIAEGAKAFQNRDFSRSADKYAQALSVKQSSATLLNLAKAYIALGDIDAVPNAFRKYKNAVNDKTVAAVAVIMDEAGYDSDALRFLSYYESTLDNRSVVYYTAGQIHEKHNRFLRAEAAYKEASKIIPTDSYYRYAYARMLDTNGSYQAAIDEYRKISNLSAERTIKANSSARAAALERYLKKLSE